MLAALALALLATALRAAPVARVHDADGYSNLRSGPGREHSVIERIPDGDCCLVLSRQSDWWRVMGAGGRVGYIHSSRLETVGDAAYPATVVDPDGVVNLRPAPTTASSVLGRIPSGEMVFVLRGGRWSHVLTRHGAEGYIHSGRLRAASAGGRSLHLIVMACTHYADPALNGISQSVGVDRRVMLDYFRSKPWSKWGARLVVHDLNGTAATARGFEQLLSFVVAEVRAEDVVVVYFSGHGRIDPKTRTPYLHTADETELDRDELARKLAGLPCRLRVLLTDCCSSFVPSFGGGEGAADEDAERSSRMLFLEHGGFTDMTAAEVGQLAYAAGDGGFFTTALLRCIDEHGTWQDVFAATRKYLIEAEGNFHRERQVPRALSLARPGASGP